MSEIREMTVKEMLGLLEWHEQMGRGDYVVKADPLRRHLRSRRTLSRTSSLSSKRSRYRRSS